MVAACVSCFIFERVDSIAVHGTYAAGVQPGGHGKRHLYC